MRTLKRKIRVDAETSVSSVWTVPDTYDPARDSGVVLAHGAGNDMHSPFLGTVHNGLARNGMLAVRFNFPYTEQGRRAPDRAPVLEATWRAVVQAVRDDPKLAPRQLFLGGKSMGGRMASHVAASGEACSGLVFLGYPLHPPGRTDKLRAEHLARIPVPMLFIEGTRDPFCELDLLQRVLKPLGVPVEVHVIEGGDHSFRVPKSLQRPEREVLNEVVDVVAVWVTRQSRTGRRPRRRA